MKRLFIYGAISALMVMTLSLSWAATNVNSSRNVYLMRSQKKPPETTTNLNSSKSNIYRLVYPADLISQVQATALLAELEKLGPADEAKLKLWLPANFKTFGIQASRIKQISVLIGRQMTCTERVETCKGRWVIVSGERVKGPRGDCSCYEPVTTQAQVRRVDKESPILILILTDPADEAKALALRPTPVVPVPVK